MVNSSLPLKLALHELRYGYRHFRVFIICLVLGITVITTINLFGAIIKNGMAREAQSLLGGDVEVTSNTELNSDQLAYLRSEGKISHIITLRGMASSNENSTLVELKAIDENYPLLGELVLNGGANTGLALNENNVVVDESLLSQLDVKLGDKINIGAAYYTITDTIKKEPDKVVQIFSFGPRIMMSHQAMARSGLLSPLSLLKHNYRVLFSDPSRIETFADSFKSKFPDQQLQIKTGTDGNQTLKSFIQQLISFLSLAGLSTFLIGGIGIGTAVRAYMSKKISTIAILKTLGGSQKQVISLYFYLLTILAIIGGFIGVVLSLMLTNLLQPVLAIWLPSVLAEKIFLPNIMLLSIWFGLLIVYIFSLPALYSAVKIKPSSLFRSSNSYFLNIINDKILWAVETALSSVLVLSIFFSTANKAFMAGALAVILMTFILFWSAANIIKFMASRIRTKNSWFKLALNNLYRPGSTTGTVIMVIGISLTVLVTLTLTQANFKERIRKIVDEQAPSLFLIDIQEHQKDELMQYLQENSYQKQAIMYPMVRGRIDKINGTYVNEKNVKEDIRWAVRGDRGLSYSNEPPLNAEISSGKWWDKDYNGKPLVSVDERFLDGMGLKIGDSITVNILGQDITAQIANARHIDYTTFQINFAMMFSENTMEKFPKTYIATAYLKKDAQLENDIVKHISKQFPGVTIIRTSSAVDLVKNIMRHISDALSVAVIISLVTGILVLAVSMASMLEQKLYDTAILKVLGAGKNTILKIYSTEWILLGLSASAISILISIFSTYLIMKSIRGEGFYIFTDVIAFTIVTCLAIIWMIGYLGNRKLFSFKPAKLLRNE